jgi:hypothetical protein
MQIEMTPSCLMEMLEVVPGREIGDRVKLLQEVADDLVRVFALAETLDLLEGAHERVFSLADGGVGVVLALAFETELMFEDFAPEEIG